MHLLAWRSHEPPDRQSHTHGPRADGEARNRGGGRQLEQVRQGHLPLPTLSWTQTSSSPACKIKAKDTEEPWERSPRD